MQAYSTPITKSFKLEIAVSSLVIAKYLQHKYILSGRIFTKNSNFHSRQRSEMYNEEYHKGKTDYEFNRQSNGLLDRRGLGFNAEIPLTSYFHRD